MLSKTTFWNGESFSVLVPGIIGSLQALEVIKLSVGCGSLYNGKMLLFDGLSASFRTIKLRNKNPACEICGENPTITQLIDYTQFCGASPDDKVKWIFYTVGLLGYFRFFHWGALKIFGKSRF